ncbi:TPA: head decoration protein [Serratia marcescens]|nr:head decoration protein [Serratia marcescens]
MTVEQRNSHRIFAGSDVAHTAIGASGLSKETPPLTPLMLAAEGGLLVAWDGQAAGAAVAVLALPHDGTAPLLTYYKSGTFAIESLLWPEGVTDPMKRNAFTGTAISVA